MKNLYNILGREYKFKLTGGTSATLTKSDIIGAKITGSTLQLPIGYQISDFKASIYSTVSSAKDIKLVLQGCNLLYLIKKCCKIK